MGHLISLSRLSQDECLTFRLAIHSIGTLCIYRVCVYEMFKCNKMSKELPIECSSVGLHIVEVFNTVLEF